MAYKQQVTVITGKTDRYGRLVGKVMVNGEDVNLEQVRRGMAWHYKAYEREQSAGDRQAYAAAENAARAYRMGLWAMPNPATAREFRRGGRGMGDQSCCEGSIAASAPAKSGDSSSVLPQVA